MPFIVFIFPMYGKIWNTPHKDHRNNCCDYGEQPVCRWLSTAIILPFKVGSTRTTQYQCRYILCSVGEQRWSKAAHQTGPIINNWHTLKRAQTTSYRLSLA